MRHANVSDSAAVSNSAAVNDTQFVVGVYSVANTIRNAGSHFEALMPETTDSPTSSKRLLSLDAYRGFVMLAMASGGLGLSAVAEKFPDSKVWEILGYESSHVEWSGCAFWDLIQPSFMFMVGVALPFSYAHRIARGDSHARIAAHALYRSVVLVALGVFLYSMGRNQTHFTFVNVLAQIGMGYFFLFLLVNRPNWFVWLAAIGILVGYWLAFALHPLPPPGFDPETVGVSKDFPIYTGFFAHWNKNANFASDFDVWFLNLLPAEKSFKFNVGGYQTLNFVPSLATMIFGLLTGRMLLSPIPQQGKVLRLFVAGAVALVVGWLLGLWVCPIVKRIWTPSWAVFSTGWTLWMLGAFYWVIDVQDWKRWWPFPLLVVGANSIAMYMMAETLHRFIAGTLATHLDLPAQRILGHGLFEGKYGPIVESVTVLLILWLACYWLWRKRIFIKI